MTREKWEKMTFVERRFKVAELCGWRWEVSSTTTAGRLCFGWKNPKGEFKGWGENKESTAGYTLPDYLNDLNAMHEVEKVFLQEDGCAWGDAWEKYCDNLAKICFLAEPVNCLMRTTASQRAEAFVLTMDKE